MQDITKQRRSPITVAKMVALVMLTFAALLVSVGGHAQPADAAGCDWQYRDTNGNNPSREFRISYRSPCRDLNARLPTVSQPYRGEYMANGQWRSGSLGWLHIHAGDPHNYELITNIRNGTRVRVTGYHTNALLLVGT